MNNESFLKLRIDFAKIKIRNSFCFQFHPIFSPNMLNSVAIARNKPTEKENNQKIFSPIPILVFLKGSNY